MTVRKSLENRVRGWLPQEPKLPPKYYRNSHGGESVSKIRAAMSFASRSNYFFGALLIIVGAIAVFFNEAALGIGQELAIFGPFLSSIFGLFSFWIVLSLLTVLSVLVLTRNINYAFIKRNLNKRRLLPYCVTAIIIFSTYLAANSGIRFAYAIPASLFISGFLVIKGLHRLTVTIPAFAMLLISILAFGFTVAGTYTVTYDPENHYLTSAQAPNVDKLNLQVNSVAGDIKLYFTNNDSQICRVAFVKEYGSIFSSRSSQYNDNSSYDNEPPSGFNYSIENGEATITASSHAALVNITVNQNLIGNFNLYTYFGNIQVEVPPTVGSIQTINLTSQIGDIHIKITNTTNLQTLVATTNFTVVTDISSTSLNQDATVQLKGGSVKLNLDLTNIKSQIFAYSTSAWGTLQATTKGFTVLNQNNSFFNAQTPNYDTSNLKKIEITATSYQSTRPSMDVTASYNEKIG